MSGTLKTDAALIAEFPVTGAGAIIPQDMWDLIVSKMSTYPTLVSAAGTVQSGATVLTNMFNVVASGTGGVVVLAGGRTEVWNAVAVPINVYPPVGAKFDNLATNAPVSLGPGGAVTTAIPTGSTQGYAR